MHYVTDIRIRLTALAPDGTQFVEEIGINGDQTQEEIWRCAHSQPDGSDPDPNAWPRDVWGVAMNLRKAERRLDAKLRDYKDHDGRIMSERVIAKRQRFDSLTLRPTGPSVLRNDPLDKDEQAYAKEHGLELAHPREVRAEMLKDQWSKAWPEVPKYQQSVSGWSRRKHELGLTDSEKIMQVDHQNPDSAEYRKAVEVFEKHPVKLTLEDVKFIGSQIPGCRVAPLADQARMLAAPSRWRCGSIGCPPRGDLEAESAPTCYTCGRPMGRVP